MRALFADSSSSHRRGFTLVEMLAAMAVFILMVSLLLAVVMQINGAWQQAESQKVRRQTARVLLDLMVRDLQAAVAPLDTANAANLEFTMNPSGFSDNRRDALFWQTSLPSRRDRSDLATVGYFVRLDGAVGKLCRLQTEGSVPSVWLQAQALAPADEHSDYQGLLAEGVLAMYVTLYDKTGAVLAKSGSPYTSPILPAAAEVAVVVADSRAARRLSLEPSYPNDVDTFYNTLPASVKSGAQIYRVRVDLPPSR